MRHNPHYVDAINQGLEPVAEPQLQTLIQKSKHRFTATTDYAKALANSTITFLIVPTPSREDGHFSADYLTAALIPLAQAFKNKNEFHTFVITSTVSPGTIQHILIPLIEKHSHKKLNQDFGVAYNPEFIALGSVIHDFLNADLVLIGESSKKVGDQLEEIYQTVCESKPYIARMSIVSAEITKISLNSYITMKISFANTITSLCAQIPDANIDDVTKALGADKRIAPHYLKGSVSFGGPCFPRDNRAFAAFAQELMIDAHLAKATDKVNAEHNQRLYQMINTLCQQKNLHKVAIFGLAYKPHTAVIEESASIHLINQLLKNNIQVMAFDPLAMANSQLYFGEKIEYANSCREAFLFSSICIFMTADPAWTTLNKQDVIHVNTTIIDCWRSLNAQEFSEHTYLKLGEYHDDWFNKTIKESAA